MIRKDHVHIPEHLAYYIASNVMVQGLHCDALARRIRSELKEWLNRLSEEAYTNISK